MQGNQFWRWYKDGDRFYAGCFSKDEPLAPDAPGFYAGDSIATAIGRSVCCTIGIYHIDQPIDPAAKEGGVIGDESISD